MHAEAWWRTCSGRLQRAEACCEKVRSAAAGMREDRDKPIVFDSILLSEFVFSDFDHLKSTRLASCNHLFQVLSTSLHRVQSSRELLPQKGGAMGKLGAVQILKDRAFIRVRGGRCHLGYCSTSKCTERVGRSPDFQ